MQFSAGALFDEAQFNEGASFYGAKVDGAGLFREAHFNGSASFTKAGFSEAVFSGARFSEDVSFHGTQVSGSAQFDRARFEREGTLGPMLTRGRLSLDGAVFEEAVLLEVVGPTLSCVGARFMQATTFRLRFAALVLDGTVFAKPSTVTFAEDSFMDRVPAHTEMVETELFDEAPLRIDEGQARPRLLSLRGVDTSTLTMAEVDLRECLFAGTHHLDQMRIEGPRPFADTPAGWQLGRVGRQGIPVWRWTRRQTLAEERLWRAGLCRRRVKTDPQTTPES